MQDNDFYQIFITGTGEYMSELLSLGLGGVIFFTKDIQTKDGFKSIINKIKSECKIPPFLAIDQEGGRVERTENISPKRLSARYAYQKGLDYLKKQTYEMSDELLNLGINLNFAPVADVNTNPLNPIIGERAFSDNVQDVITCVKLVSKIYMEKGIIPCAKHFPGHGDAAKDSHKELPVINLGLSEMEKYHLAPFRAAVGFGVPMIMIAHLDCICFGEAGIPCSLSPQAVKYLRKELGFNGVIITDDMNMGGLTSIDPLQAAIRAIKAGVNILLYRDSGLETFNLINNLKSEINKDLELKYALIQSINKINSLKTLIKMGNNR